ncbi:hypothetical protein [Sporomusa acidovorans]|uniref:hypothetical protein n=1 Tax=Sporomusa acidovorans TaxID=112900 RepID=UPI001C409D99|nr:hypothetical protein [Sporomusa acidovorans]
MRSPDGNLLPQSHRVAPGDRRGRGKPPPGGGSHGTVSKKVLALHLCLYQAQRPGRSL